MTELTNRQREAAEYRRHHANAAEYIAEAITELEESRRYGFPVQSTVFDHLRRALAHTQLTAGLR